MTGRKRLNSAEPGGVSQRFTPSGDPFRKLRGTSGSSWQARRCILEHMLAGGRPFSMAVTVLRSASAPALWMKPLARNVPGLSLGNKPLIDRSISLQGS